MKKFVLFLMLSAVVSIASAASPESYQQLKAEFKNMPVRVQKVNFIKKHVAIGVTAGAVMFAMNEYFIRTENQAFHDVMPYVAIAYGLFQSYSILRGSSIGSSGGTSGSGAKLTLCTF
jgi:undecaprenyl pyrophosphate phosphatase UppP